MVIHRVSLLVHRRLADTFPPGLGRKRYFSSQLHCLPEQFHPSFSFTPLIINLLQMFIFQIFICLTFFLKIFCIPDFVHLWLCSHVPDASAAVFLIYLFFSTLRTLSPNSDVHIILSHYIISNEWLLVPWT